MINMNDKKLIAFTFDDAPTYGDLEDSPTTTTLETLAHFNGKATFFSLPVHA